MNILKDECSTLSILHTRIFPTILAKQINGDIGICPLEDVVFNNSKSCLKFYEYSACGMATIAPRILPYSEEVDYTYADLNDFENKFKKLLKDKELRREVAQRQMKWVLENRDINKIVNKWIKIYGKKTKAVITGGGGFVGANFVEHFLKETDWEIIVLDKLSYATNGYDRLRDINVFDEKRVKIFTVDLNLPLSDGVKKEIGEVDYIINLASESHVDNSIAKPVEFIQNNVNLVLNMLEWARELKNLKKFIQFSTDEIFGTAPEGVNYKEGDRSNPGNPYSASKLAQEAIARAYSNTYGLPINITNTMNIIGERQHPEKFVPICIRKILNGETIQIHSDPTLTKSGTRYYLHARNIAKAITLFNRNK